MSKFAKLAVVLAVSAFSVSVMAADTPNHQWHRPPFPVVKGRVIHRMEMLEKALPGRIKCVQAAKNFKAMHACFPHHKKWHHWKRQTPAK